MEDRRTDNLIVEQNQFKETEEAKEKPIKVRVWENAPKSDAEHSIRERVSEFFYDPEISPENKALGLMAQEFIVKGASEVDQQDYQMAVNYGALSAGKNTLYAMELYADNLNIALSPTGDYPNFAMTILTLPLDRLSFMTGGVAKDVGMEIPEVVQALLSKDATVEQKRQAKVDLMRFLAKKKPDDVKAINEIFIGNIGLAYVPDRQNTAVRIDVEDIPISDPILGESINLYNMINVYKNTELTMNNAEMFQMTTEKIEGYLKRLPEWVQKKLMGENPNPGFKSWRIFQFFEKFGYKGNQFQQKFDRTDKMRTGFVNFTNEIRTRILQTIANGTSVQENGLDMASIDKLFIQSYEQRRGNNKLPDGFSITDIIMNKVPITDVKMNS